MVKTAVGSKGAPSSRSNDDYIKRSDLDALFKMLKENGNTYGYSFGASMIAYKDDHLIRELVERLEARNELRKLPWITLVRRSTSKRDQDKGGAVWIRSGHSWKGKATLQPVQAFCGEFLMDSNELSMVEETRSRSEEKKERENECAWSSWIKTAWESCGIWSNHEKEEPLKVRAAEKDQTASLEEIQVKVEPLREVAAEEGQTARLEEIQVKVESLKEVAAEEGQTARLEVHEAKGVIYSLRQGKDELYQLVGRLREVESELSMVKTHAASPSWCQGRRKQNVIFGFLMGEICELVEHMCDVWEINNKADRWKRGTSCKKGKLRKLSKMWVMMSRLWRKDIKESMQVGECLYSAYIGESVESSGVMRKLETKGADEPVTKEEWDEFVKSWILHTNTQSTRQARRKEKTKVFDKKMDTDTRGHDQNIKEKPCTCTRSRKYKENKDKAPLETQQRLETTPLDHERGNGTESGEQEQNQEDSGLHDQDTSQEVENNVQSSGEVDEVQSSGEVDEVQSSREERVRPASSEEEQVEPASLPWITLVRRSTSKRDQDKGGAVWIRSGHSWKGKATLQPVQACEASQQPASLDFTCFQSHFEIPFPVPACRDALPLSINGHMPSLVKAKHDQTVNFFSRSPLADPSPLWTGESVPLFPSSPASSKPWSSSSDTDSLPPSCAKWDGSSAAAGNMGLVCGSARREEKEERGNEWGWFSQMKATLKTCGVWRNHEKEESLKGKAAEKDQTARETSGNCFSLEESTLLEKIEDVYENKISLRRVYEVKK
ncbi:hypothetical protein IGI04_042640, partial [Brassica rapa subsp. trilocularis]